MLLHRKTDFERFVDAFNKRYGEELKQTGAASEREMLWLYLEYRGSDKTPEQWLEENELA
jgi:hypothetical protein